MLYYFFGQEISVALRVTDPSAQQTKKKTSCTIAAIILKENCENMQEKYEYNPHINSDHTIKKFFYSKI